MFFSFLLNVYQFKLGSPIMLNFHCVWLQVTCAKTVVIVQCTDYKVVLHCEFSCLLLGSGHLSRKLSQENRSRENLVKWSEEKGKVFFFLCLFDKRN